MTTRMQTTWHEIARADNVECDLRNACYAFLDFIPKQAGLSTISLCFKTIASSRTMLNILDCLTDDEYTKIVQRFGYSQWRMHGCDDVDVHTKTRVEESFVFIYNAACAAMQLCSHLDTPNRPKENLRCMLNMALFAQRAFEFIHEARTTSDPILMGSVAVTQGGSPYQDAVVASLPFTNSHSLDVLSTLAHAYCCELQMEAKGDSHDASERFSSWLYISSCYQACYDTSTDALVDILSISRYLTSRLVAVKRRIAKIHGFLDAMEKFYTMPGAHTAKVRAYRATLTAINAAESSVNKHKPLFNSGRQKSLEDDPLQFLRHTLLQFLEAQRDAAASYFDDGRDLPNSGIKRDLENFEIDIRKDIPVSTNEILRFYPGDQPPEELDDSPCNGAFAWREDHREGPLVDCIAHLSHVLNGAVSSGVITRQHAQQVLSTIYPFQRIFCGESTQQENDGTGDAIHATRDHRNLTYQQTLGRLYHWMEQMKNTDQEDADVMCKLIGYAYGMCAERFFTNKKVNPRNLHTAGQMIHTGKLKAAGEYVKNFPDSTREPKTSMVSDDDIYEMMLRMERFNNVVLTRSTHQKNKDDSDTDNTRRKLQEEAT